MVDSGKGAREPVSAKPSGSGEYWGLRHQWGDRSWTAAAVLHPCHRKARWCRRCRDMGRIGLGNVRKALSVPLCLSPVLASADNQADPNFPHIRQNWECWMVPCLWLPIVGIKVLPVPTVCMSALGWGSGDIQKRLGLSTRLPLKECRVEPVKQKQGQHPSFPQWVVSFQ